MTMEMSPEDEGGFRHDPVMPTEVIRSLNLQPGKCAVDVTLGGGGHAALILAATAPDGVLVGIDRDLDALAAARDRLASAKDRVRFQHGRMSEIARLMAEAGFARADAILADLGVSSFHFDQASRGFSLRQDAPLDMRMDQSSGESAAELIAASSEAELERIIREYGEERFSRRIARAIASRRDLSTTSRLAEAVVAAIPPPARRGGRIHPATRTFQALRIAVNDELGELARLLDAAPMLLAPGGRMVVISYHSLEDRLVKRSFRALAEGEAFTLPARRAMKPTASEVERNPRARSAKLRVLERAASGEER